MYDMSAFMRIPTRLRVIFLIPSSRSLDGSNAPSWRGSKRFDSFKWALYGPNV
jgi:hypothetical protein